jgi:hypothetical protein
MRLQRLHGNENRDAPIAPTSVNVMLVMSAFDESRVVIYKERYYDRRVYAAG